MHEWVTRHGGVGLGNSPVLGLHVSHDVLVEELEDEWDAVGKDQMLRHELKLVDMVEAEVFEEQQQCGGDSFHQNLLVAVDIHAKLHALHHRHAAERRT